MTQHIYYHLEVQSSKLFNFSKLTTVTEDKRQDQLRYLNENPMEMSRVL